jgi:hypothetical protein
MPSLGLRNPLDATPPLDRNGRYSNHFHSPAEADLVHEEVEEEDGDEDGLFSSHSLEKDA